MLELLPSNLLCLEDPIKWIWDLLDLLLVAQHLALINTEEKLDIKAVDVLVHVLRHGVPGFAKREQSQETVLALELLPVSICVATRLFSFQHLVLLELDQELLPLIKQGSAK